MKTATQFFPLVIAMFIIGLAGQANAQGRGHHKEHERGARGDGRSDHHRDGHHHHHAKYKYKHKHDRHPDRVRYGAHYHDRHCSHTPVVVHHYHERPRYIYYRDYDVYYDIHRSVYISWSGRNWFVSASVPVVLHRVDRQRAVRMEVEYYQDNFTDYLASGRPVYRSVYAEF